jgi:methionine synthase I (cobalamin-dependent)
MTNTNPISSRALFARAEARTSFEETIVTNTRRDTRAQSVLEQDPRLGNGGVGAFPTLSLELFLEKAGSLRIAGFNWPRNAEKLGAIALLRPAVGSLDIIERSMTYQRIRHRLRTGRPLVLDADSGASLRARGVELDVPGTLGQLLRERPSAVLSHHEAEVASRVDIISALSADTTPRALAEVGMQHRAAQLTGRALELAFEAAADSPRPVAVAGLLGSDMVGPMVADRLHEELMEHAARLSVSGSELIIARGQGSRIGLMAAVVAAARTELPTWAVVECGVDGELDGGRISDLLRSLRDAGATTVLFEVPSVAVGLIELERTRAIVEELDLEAGVLLAASESAVRGFEEPTSEPEAWADRALDLTLAGARVVGGGAGTTETHTRALALALGSLHPSVATTRSDTELDGGPRDW